MSKIFEERERGYEAKWAHDEEKHFKVMARRNALLGRWAAGEMGLRDAQADDYATAVIHIGLVGRGADPVFDKIRNDVAARKINVSDRTIHQKMEDFFHRAGDEVAE
jgi:hypothetical protein